MESFVAFTHASGYRLFAPGDEASPGLAGMAEDGHPDQKSQDTRPLCLECHEQEGLHGRLVKANPKLSCASCHGSEGVPPDVGIV